MNLRARIDAAIAEFAQVAPHWGTTISSPFNTVAMRTTAATPLYRRYG